MTIMEIVTLVRLIIEVLKEVGILSAADRQALKDGLAVYQVGEPNSDTST